MTPREAELEKEVARLRMDNAEIRRYFERPEHSLVQNGVRWWLGLDDYELANLREALRAVAQPYGAGSSPLDALNSGDWVYQILSRLETVGPAVVPNRAAPAYRESARAWKAP